MSQVLKVISGNTQLVFPWKLVKIDTNLILSRPVFLDKAPFFEKIAICI